MTATFLLLTTAWLAGADPGAPMQALPAAAPVTVISQTPCAGTSCPVTTCCSYCKPTLKDRFSAFHNCCGACKGCGPDGCTPCYAKPTLKDRFDAFRNACGTPKCCSCKSCPAGSCPSACGN